MFHWIVGVIALANIVHSATPLRGVEIYSNATVQYGRWEIRMKAAATPGTVSSFFTYYPDSWKGSPEPWREIDIEVLGNHPEGFQSNLITGSSARKATSEVLHKFAGDLSNEYHTYAVEWTPDSVVWRLDGKLVRKVGASDPQVVDLRDKQQTFRMNLWASNSPGWVGALDEAKLPVLQVVHWMTYSSYTPGAGDNGGDFTFQWKDSFAKIDATRWGLGDWTFDGNLATFSPSNAFVKDGYLVMVLTTADDVGARPDFPRDAGNVGVASRTSGGTLQSIGESLWQSTQPVDVLDHQGRVVARSHAVDGLHRVELRSLPVGTYFLRSGSEVRSIVRPERNPN